MRNETATGSRRGTPAFDGHITDRPTGEQAAVRHRTDASATTDAVEPEADREPALPPDACWDWSPLPEDASFALCLTHDVDRPYKGGRSLYYALREGSTYHLKTLRSSGNPYWQFEEIAALEDDLGVRSAFYFLNEQHLLAERPVRDWLSSTNWVQHLGRYDPTSPPIADVIETLAADGWEVGLHGSFHSAEDRERLRHEVSALEAVLDGVGETPHQANDSSERIGETPERAAAPPDEDESVASAVAGGRQHYLRLSIPETWRHHRAIGLRYDASLGSGTECGFHHGYRPIQPFGDDFRVFPLSIMEQALPDPADEPESARAICEELLLEAAANEAVMTVLWHPRYFNEREFPGYRGLYRWLVERAQDLDAWIGPPRDLLDAFDRERAQTGDRLRSDDPTRVDRPQSE